MSWKFAKLLEVTLEHPYYAGAEEPPFEVLPTDSTRSILAANKLVHRVTATGCVILYEIDPFDENGILPYPRLSNALVLEFYVRPKSPNFASVTGFPTDQRPFVALTNEDSANDGDYVRIHDSDTLSPDDLVVLKGYAFTLNIESENPSVRAELQGPDGRIQQSDTLELEDGAGLWSVNLEGAPTGAYTLYVDGVERRKLYVDVALLRQNAVALLSLQAAPLGNDDSAFLNEDEEPVFRNFLVRFPSRTTTWRYIVITRDYAALDENDLSISDTILVNNNPRYEFQATGPKAALPNGEQAVIFASTGPIPIMRRPISGLALRRAGANNSFSSIRENLPNPSPNELSQTSTVAAPVSDVFVYI